MAEKISLQKIVDLKGGSIKELCDYARQKGVNLPSDPNYLLSISQLYDIDPILAYKLRWGKSTAVTSNNSKQDGNLKKKTKGKKIAGNTNVKGNKIVINEEQRKLRENITAKVFKFDANKEAQIKRDFRDQSLGIKKRKKRKMARTPNPQIQLKRGEVKSIKVIKSFGDVDAAIECFLWPNPQYKREDDYYVQDLIGKNNKLMSYYHQKMIGYFGIDHILKKEYVSIKNPTQIEFKNNEKDRFGKLDSIGYKTYRIEQPIASLLVEGLTNVIKFDSECNVSIGETLIIYALPETDKSTKLLWSDETQYSIFHNSLNMGNIAEVGLPENVYIGYIKIGKKTINGYYGITNRGCFLKPLSKITHNLDYYVLNNKKPENIRLENHSIKVPLCDNAWKDLCRLSNSVYFYWKQSFDCLYSSEYGFGDEEGLYDIIFYNKKEEKHCLQENKNAIKKDVYISEPDKNEFYALVFDFEKISFKPKYQSSFNVLRKREWTLDWKYVNFRNGYFVVSPPENGIIKFNPLAVSYPGVLESFNYLKDYLNDRLYPVRCFVEEMKLTIYDRIRLDEAIVKFTKASKQRAIKTSSEPTINRIAPQQLPFSQALSKAQQMTPEEFKKYKSKYIDYLVAEQSKDYKIVPCAERLAHTTGDTTEFAFLFSIPCGNDKVMIVHENVNPDRSTLLFLVRKEEFQKSIRAIYDFLQSPEINKRSSLRSRDLEIDSAKILRYKSINHDDYSSWKQTILFYKKYYWG